jgi:hypothetical protein
LTVLANLADEATLPAPSIMVVGRVVAEELSQGFRLGPETADLISPPMVI